MNLLSEPVMSDVIRLLPDAVANQIAAGEVIQRPASVIKELVENAIDAGATTIDIVVMDAGKSQIQVIDNGKGMSEMDARLSFERHATSKIRQFDDLASLTTKGFRGEALASIAAVAQVELRTRRPEDELGTLICLNGSKLEKQEPVSCPSGSNFLVKNLFYNVPARRKFLKSNQTELNNILAEVDRMVLVHPEISFSLQHNGVDMYKLPATTLRLRLMNVFGKKLNEQLLPVEVKTTLVEVKGYVGKPESSRKKGSHQYFFANNRYMRHPYFHKAVTEAYEQLVPPGEQVSYFLYLDVDPSDLDVNIHPTKTEVKFENEQAIWQILYAGVKESLGKFGGIPSIDFDTEGMPDIPTYQEQPPVEAPQVNYNPNFNPFDEPSKPVYSRKKIDWEAAYRGLERGGDTYMKESRMGQKVEPLPVFDEIASSLGCDASEEVELPSAANQANQLPTSSSYYQFKGQYIVTSVKSGLMLIDQQRAHVRVLYDRFMTLFSHAAATSQGVLFPEMIQLTPAEEVVLDTIGEELTQVGFELTNLGGGSYAINGIPSGTEGVSPTMLVRQMLASALEKGSEVKQEVHSLIALSLAKSASIVAGQVLSNEEMVELVNHLFSSVTPNYTPDGKKTLVILPMDEIEKKF